MEDTVQNILILRTQAIAQDNGLERLAFGTREMAKIPNPGKHFVEGNGLAESLGRHHREELP